MPAEDIKELCTALAKAQGQVENAKKDTANPFFKSKYADLAGVWDAIRGPLSANGLSVIQQPLDGGVGGITLRTLLLHASGQALESQFTMPLKPNASAQDVGSALTYARRYTLMALVGIAPEDDDGNAASGRPAAAKAIAIVDWDQSAKEYQARFKTSGSDPDRRLIYSEVRNSQMPEPLKTTVLTNMSASLKGKAIQ
ncbi:ERF family protein [Acidithiobacillus sp.]|uniref:ERF family protein n=1 Tax=Acidithiobacillus sp. TaxID=1872118 RepID=UPI00258ACAC5|nr:ERF family protein [Acidithiobacillus sp.]MDD5374452.1 ERF family protein [Acidithiobacillus sp.]